MPDWTYRTLLRPVLFRLRPETARDLALGAMGRLSRLPGGVRLIQFLGHMRPDPRLEVSRPGLAFPSAVGLGCRLDPHLTATRAFAEFGFGFLEIGPIVARPVESAGPWTLDRAAETLSLHAPIQSLPAAEASRRLRQMGDMGLPILARIDPQTAAEAKQIMAALASHVNVFVVPLAALDYCSEQPDGAASSPAIFVHIAPDQWQDPASRRECEGAIRNGRVAGVVVDSAPSSGGGAQLGRPDQLAALQSIRSVRDAAGPQLTIIAAAGIHNPAEALEAVETGADLVQVDSGLVFSGPSLPKRINEAALHRQLLTPANAPAAALPAIAKQPARLPAQSWFWAMLLGVALFAGGVLALAIASTRVLLPYDEILTGLTRDQLHQINPRLLAFMTHDRVTLAGTMLAVGLQYAGLAAFGIRQGMHWAYVAATTSAVAGFLTFFTFLGFGYFDPFHAFVAAILLQLTLLAMQADLPASRPTAAPELHNNDAWQAHQWGQLLFVIHGVLLIAAGAAIAAIGMTQVFVAEDLEFLRTTREALVGAHPQLIPLVAHDRATFGGMLLSGGLVTLLSALWGFRRGYAWLWWTLMVSGNIAYLTTLAVHMNVGYESHKHLLPIYGGLTLLWAGGLFSYPFMAGRDEMLEAEWRQRLGGAKQHAGE